MATNSDQAPAGKGSSTVVITVLAVMVGLVLAGLLVTLSQTKIYQATATLRIHSAASVPATPGGTIASPSIFGPAELNTIFATFSNQPVLDNVAAHLTGADLRQFMAPYDATDASSRGPRNILRDNLKVTMQRGSFVILVQYRHPDPQMAAKIANYFTDEYLSAAASGTGFVPMTIVDRALPPPPDAYVSPKNIFQWFKR